jgi:hypothetical protein
MEFNLIVLSALMQFVQCNNVSGDKTNQLVIVIVPK